ncbi:recombinase family protein [Streptomyces sp. TRM68416]|uniref:recombinase family protein n=1 Tax=Streptomyces sp. TRM68416 TaxID=2758412 RepID=UPI001CB6F76F|nr:recombinase family protein [Streptomyces sp. TRM68416]
MRSSECMNEASQVTPGRQSTRQVRGVNPNADQPRAVSAIRLSVATDETTSPARQREANERAAASLGAVIVGEAEDLDVSASKTTPFERPELGPWFERPEDFDMVIWWRLDRAVRSMADMSALVGWARKHGKRLVFAEGPGGARLELDMSNVVGELIATLLAFAAQMEAQSIAERVTGAQAAMRVMPLRWRGSRPHYGYEPAPLDGGGWTLVPDAEAVAVIERMIKDLSAGKTASVVAAELNEEGIPSPRDHWALRKGRTTGGKTGGSKGEHVKRERFKWGPSIVKRVLTSAALIGWKLHQNKPVRDSEGRPVMATTTPVLTRAEYDAIGALFDERSVDNRERKDTDALLLRVIHCDGCGGRMYLNKQTSKANQRPTYKCNAHARGETCAAPAYVRADWVDEYVEREFLRLTGSLAITETRTVPGYDPGPEIAATLVEFEEHQRQEGRHKSNAARQAWQKRADALDARLAELEATPKVEPRHEVIRTGRVYADEWHASETADRRAMLIEAGARLTVTRGTRGGWRRLDESRVHFTVNGPLDDAIDTLLAVRQEAQELAA